MIKLPSISRTELARLEKAAVQYGDDHLAAEQGDIEDALAAVDSKFTNVGIYRGVGHIFADHVESVWVERILAARTGE